LIKKLINEVGWISLNRENPWSRELYKMVSINELFFKANDLFVNNYALIIILSITNTLNEKPLL